MQSSIQLAGRQRKMLLHYYRSHEHPEARLRAHIVLLLADGYSWAMIAAVLFCSTRTIARWKTRFEKGGVHALLGQKSGTPAVYGHYWLRLVVHWFTDCVPKDFGFVRSRWSCALATLLLWEEHRLHVSVETVRRWLHQAALVWRRPRPVLTRTDPERGRILARLRQLLRELPEDETVVFMDEVDLNLNPDIGFMWMRRGQQAKVETPGVNAKNYLAGSLHWRTGAILGAVTGQRRNAALVVSHLEALCRSVRRYKVIHVVWDNAKIHDCAAVTELLARHGQRLRIHPLPKYAPECNPAERVWWHLREEITRNHRCKTLQELIDLVFDWLEGKWFLVEDEILRDKTAAPTSKAA
jgi:putative transposase